MFFIKAGTVMAWVMVVFGAFKLISGLFVAFGFEGKSMLAASERYLGTTTSGEAIDRGLTVFAAGILVGLLVEVAKK